LRPIDIKPGKLIRILGLKDTSERFGLYYSDDYDLHSNKYSDEAITKLITLLIRMTFIINISAQFNKKDLDDRIKKIRMLSDRISFYKMDTTTFLQNELPKIIRGDIFLNIDPLYVKKGKLLYENSFSEADHTELCRVVRALNYKWIVTYDECDIIRQLYADCRKQTVSLDYSAGRTRKGSEFLIFGNLIEIPDANKSAG